MNRRPIAAWGAALLLLAMASGCGDGRITVHPVAGQVLVDGQPADNASVVFHPTGADATITALRPSARTDEQGRFSLSTYQRGDGAPPGTYKITVTWNGPPPDTRPEDVPEQERHSGPDRLAGAYDDPSTTTLSAEVATGPNQLAPLELTMPR
ncbi:MAG: carboxypeptidase regulatory-like domain-containing protein [Planctomycetales bacterium]|nr:carboxypeptidase regulatory-like domain-containing protein [Planctomycetales bacterium]